MSVDVAKPTLYDGTDTITLEYPSDWNVEQVIGDTELTTLSGKLLTQTSYRKYRFSLIYDALWTDKYDELEDFINNVIDNGLSSTFTFDKWPQTVGGTIVRAILAPRKKVLGRGETYYSGVTLTLTQISRVGPAQAYPYLPD